MRMFAMIVVLGADAGIVKIEEVVEIVIVMGIVEIEVEVIGIAVTETEMIETVAEEGIETGEADVTIGAAETIEIAGGVTIVAAGMIEIAVGVTIVADVMIEIADGVMIATVVVKTNSTLCRFKSSNYGKIHPHATGQTLR